MEFQGVFENGVVSPTGSVNLPEGTKVEFHRLRAHAESEIEQSTREFFANRSLDELLRDSGVKPITDTCARRRLAAHSVPTYECGFVRVAP